MNDALVPYQRSLPDTPKEMLSGAFSLWETRGRGWSLFDSPVELEPPFCPLYCLLDVPEPPVTDDGRQPTFFSDLLDGLKGNSADNSSALIAYREQVAEYQSFITEATEPLFCQYYNKDFLELGLVLPKDLKVSKAAAANLLTSLSYLLHPASFEIIGNRKQIVIQFACAEKDLFQVKQQLKSHLPSCFLKETTGQLSDTWINGEPHSLMVDFGLSNEFMLPLKTASQFDTDLLVTIIGALSNLSQDEVGVFQVLFQKTKNDWATEIIETAQYFEEVRSLAKASPNLHLAREKVRSPLFAVCIRVAGRSFNEQRAWQIVKSLGAGLSNLSNPIGNELIPLSNDDYPAEYHEQALLNRQSFRGGMILNLDELASIVHPPSNAVQSEKLQREMEQTKSVPPLAVGHSLILGENLHQNEIRKVSLSETQRTKHIHLIGASGSGKSTLLLNLIKQDLENNQGLCVIDPHGDLIEEVVENIPESRIKDVVFFDPADSEFPIGFNILQANSELEKTLLSSDLVATFRRMSTSWGDVMDSVLANAILAFVESEKGGTLFDLKRFLVEKDFRNEFLQSVQDEAIRYFWINEFPLITGKPQSSILIRLDTFLRQKLIRNIVCQKENRINFREIMDNRKVLLIKLSQGAIGEENSYLLGTLLVSKLYQTALSRQDTQNRPFFSCYLDEFHHFITPSMESVLSGVRKYNLGLVLAHQEFRQLQSRSLEVASSVLSNCYTRICFRLGDTDAERFASGFSFFDAKALQNLSVGEAIGRIERSEYDFNLKTNLLPKVPSEIAEQRKVEIIRSSRENYGTAKPEVEAKLFTAQAKLTVATEIPAKDDTQKAVGQFFKEQAIKNKVSIIETKQSKSEPIFDHGNSQHQYLQNLVKRIAEKKGFQATIEKQVFGGIRKIDVALENGRQKIACEISVTTPADYELQNIQKCLASGYKPIITISADEKHLTEIKRKAEENLAQTDLAKIVFLKPEAVADFLESIADSSEVIENKIKGFKINIEYPEQAENEQKVKVLRIKDMLLNIFTRRNLNKNE